jgi:hypothetical protein
MSLERPRDSSLRSPTDRIASGSRMYWRLADASLRLAMWTYRLVAPTIVHDPTRRRVPIPVRIVLGLIGASDFMQLSQTLGRAFWLDIGLNAKGKFLWIVLVVMRGSGWRSVIN